MCKKVLQYKGHVNDYRPCKSPLVDHKEDFVFAGEYTVVAFSWGGFVEQILNSRTRK